MLTPKLPALLPGLSLALLLTACGGDVKSTPPAPRFERVALPVAPEGEAVCDGEPCLSDREVGVLLNATIDALCEANDRIAWLSDYYRGTKLAASCPPGN